MAGFEIIKKKNKNKGMNLTRIIVVYILLLSFFVTYFSVFDIEEVRPFMVYLMLFLEVYFMMLLQYIIGGNPKRKKKIICAFVIFTLILLLFFRKNIVRGIAPFVNKYIESINKYYGTTQPQIIAATHKTDIILVLFMMQMIFAVVLILILSKRRFGVIAFIIMLFPVILEALVGYMPSVYSGLGLLAAGCMYFICYHQQDGSIGEQEIISALGILLLLFACAVIIQPGIGKYKEKNYEKYLEISEVLKGNQSIDTGNFYFDFHLENNFLNWFEGKGDYTKGGVGHGELSNIYKFNPKGTKEMEVILDSRPTEQIYLKAFVGINYTGEKWEELKESDISGEYSVIKEEENKRIIMNRPYIYLNQEVNPVANKKVMNIKLLNASTRFGYVPYYAYVTEDEKIYLDAYVEGGGKKTHSYEFYPRADYYTRIILNVDETGDIEELEDISNTKELWDTYVDFVSQNKKYKKYPDNLGQLWDFCRNIVDTGGFADIDRVYNEICVKFKTDLSYSLTPGELPQGKDFVEYFLFENEKGFCVHFASAATLIYRECGVPARYVEGYSIPADKFVAQEDGTFKAIVTDEMAHAWCETFDENTGWTVRDHTLSSMNQSSVNNRESQTQQQETTTNQEETSTHTNIENETRPKEEQSSVTKETEAGGVGGINGGGDFGKILNAIKNIVLGVLGACGIIILLIVFVVAQYKCRRKNKMRKFMRRKENRGISSIYNEIYHICVFAGMSEIAQSDKEQMEQMKESFTQLSKKEWKWVYDCAVRAAFADELIEKEERKQMFMLYQKFRKEIMKQLTVGKRFVFLYVRAM